MQNEVSKLARKQIAMMSKLKTEFATIKDTAAQKEAELIASDAEKDAVKKAKTVRQNAQAREIRLDDMSDLWKSYAETMQHFKDEQMQSIGVYEIDKFARLVASLHSESEIPYFGKVKTDDNFVAAFALMKAHKVLHVSCGELQRELDHASERQANGIRSVLTASKLFVVQRITSAKDWTIKFNPDHALASKLAKIYSFDDLLSVQIDA